MFEDEVYLNIKPGVEFSRNDRDGFIITRHKGSEMLVSYSKWEKNRNIDYTYESTNDADAATRYHNIFNTVSGHVLLLGLGSGITQMIIADIPEVTKITTVEKNLASINLYKRGNYPNTNKITFVNDNAYEIAGHYDYIVCDLISWMILDQFKVKPLKATSTNPILYPDFSDWPGKEKNPEQARPWPGRYDLDDPLLLDTKARIVALNAKINA